MKMAPISGVIFYRTFLSYMITICIWKRKTPDDREPFIFVRLNLSVCSEHTIFLHSASIHPPIYIETQVQELMFFPFRQANILLLAVSCCTVFWWWTDPLPIPAGTLSAWSQWCLPPFFTVRHIWASDFLRQRYTIKSAVSISVQSVSWHRGLATLFRRYFCLPAMIFYSFQTPLLYFL